MEVEKMMHALSTLTPLALLMATLSFFLAAPAHAQGSKIKMISEAGISDEAMNNVQLGIDTTTRFFRETYGLELKNELRVILVPDKNAYATALMREAKVDQKEAERRARTTLGWSTGNAIIQNTGGIPNARRRVYNMSHEIVHAYQAQVCSGDCAKIKWLYEGTAGVLATRIVDMCGLRPLAEHRQGWLQQLKNKASNAPLKDLKSKDDWYSALDKYGVEEAYGFAGLAVFDLVDKKGYESLFTYFRSLKDSGSQESFQRAFATDLGAYEKQFDEQIKQELAALPAK
jgi:hypothetical protein